MLISFWPMPLREKSCTKKSQRKSFRWLFYFLLTKRILKDIQLPHDGFLAATHQYLSTLLHIYLLPLQVVEALFFGQ